LPAVPTLLSLLGGAPPQAWVFPCPQLTFNSWHSTVFFVFLKRYLPIRCFLGTRHVSPFWSSILEDSNHAVFPSLYQATVFPFFLPTYFFLFSSLATNNPGPHSSDYWNFNPSPLFPFAFPLLFRPPPSFQPAAVLRRQHASLPFCFA